MNAFIFQGGISMKRSGLFQMIIFLLITFIFYVLLASQDARAEQAAEKDKMQPPEINHVFLIIADGLQTWADGAQQPPNLNAFGDAGVVTKQLLPSLPDSPRAAAATALTGLEPSRHGYIDQKDVFRFETITGKLTEKGIKTALFDGPGNVLAPLTGSSSYFVSRNQENNDRAVMDTALMEFEKNSYFMNIIFLPELRESWSASGPDSKEYRDALANLDNQVGRLWHYLNQRALAQKSVIIITGTCGTPPLIMRGPGLKCGALLSAAALSDVAPTLATMLDIPLPAVSGMVLWDAYEPTGKLSESYFTNRRLNDLSVALYQAKRENNAIHEEKIDAEKGHFRIAADKQLIMKEIARRDLAISQLNFKVKLMKIFLLLMTGVFILAVYYQYRHLRKKFLFFD